MKQNIKYPKSVKEAIDDLEIFFDCDLYSKFRPEIKINKKRYYRQDFFKSEKEFREYLSNNFNILRKEIKRLKILKRIIKNNE